MIEGQILEGNSNLFLKMYINELFTTFFLVQIATNNVLY